MKVVIGFLIALSLTSCVTQNRCYKKYPPEVKDSIVYREVIVPRDTTIYLPGEVLVVQDHAYCDSLNRAQMPKKTVKAGRLNATVEIKNGELKVECKEDSLISLSVTLQEKIKTLESYHSEIKPPLIEYKRHWYDKVFQWIALVALLFGGGYLFKKFKP